MPFTNSASTENLEENLSLWRAFDCRHDLAKPQLGAQLYREGHIPGALFADLEHDLSGPKNGTNGRHPLPDPGAFIAWVGQQGLKPSDQAVCYDEGGGTMAARLWWMLRWIGHDAVAVLDGGLAKWRKEGRPISAALPRFAHSAYPVRMRPASAVDVDYVEQNIADIVLLDARAPARFRGEHEPIDPVAGHIPGAKNRFCTENLENGVFKSSDLLKKEFSALLGGRNPADVVNYCGSGVAACHNLLAMEIAGLKSARLYAGSWSEWIADPRRPQARGS